MTQLPTPGRALRVLREQSGLTARELAERAGVSESYLSRVETGREAASPAWIGNVAAAISRALADTGRTPKAAA